MAGQYRAFRVEPEGVAQRLIGYPHRARAGKASQAERNAQPYPWGAPGGAGPEGVDAMATLPGVHRPFSPIGRQFDTLYAPRLRFLFKLLRF